MPTVEFDREKTVEVDDPDLTLLEIAREAGIPHASACGGNGRCSTCRVMILEHPENLDPRNAVETRLARAKGFDDNIRLACQTTITGDVKLRRLVIDEEDLQIAQDGTPQTTGKDRQLAILFSDIRNFTPFAESHLPYDVIHILGRYFRKVGEPVIRHGGYIDKYMGDGIMAIFGLERASAAEACLDAVAAGLGMQDSLLELNEYIENYRGEENDAGSVPKTLLKQRKPRCNGSKFNNDVRASSDGQLDLSTSSLLSLSSASSFNGTYSPSGESSSSKTTLPESAPEDHDDDDKLNSVEMEVAAFLVRMKWIAKQ